MPIEIEAKLKIDSHDSIVEKLKELGAEQIATLRQWDFYFDDPQNTIINTDCCLRIRSETVLQGKDAGYSETILCYKGPKQAGLYKSREELETSVSHLENTLQILGRLGYIKRLAFDKLRELYNIGSVEVCLDTLPLLGPFVEIEGPDQQAVLEVQKMLALEKIPHEVRSYACLIDEKLKETNSEKNEIHLDNIGL